MANHSPIFHNFIPNTSKTIKPHLNHPPFEQFLERFYSPSRSMSFLIRFILSQDTHLAESTTKPRLLTPLNSNPNVQSRSLSKYSSQTSFESR